MNIVVESREIVECPTITSLENLFGLANKMKGKTKPKLYIYKINNKLFFRVYAYQFQHPKRERKLVHHSHSSYVPLLILPVSSIPYHYRKKMAPFMSQSSGD